MLRSRAAGLRGRAAVSGARRQRKGQNAEITYVLNFNGTSTAINCGSDASLDDKPAGGIITIDGWVLCSAAIAATYVICGKGATANRGFWFIINGTDDLQLVIELATTDVSGVRLGSYRDGAYHHVVGYYNDATKKARCAVDGTWGLLSGAGSGNYVSDAGDPFEIGKRPSFAAWWWKGGISWLRFSNNDRFGAAAGAAFTPPVKCIPPDLDANTIELWKLDEGTGALAAASVSTPANDGTIANGAWELCSP